MFITGIRYRKHGIKSAAAWRFTQGVGKLRPVVTVVGDDESLELLAHALYFALAGRRHRAIAEVWLDAADDAGDVWTIERGLTGSVFRRNGRLLTIDEAQRSLLASLLDLDASLNQADALVAPVELRLIIAQGAEVAATSWDMNSRQGRSEVVSVIAAKELSKKLAAETGHQSWGDPRRLSRIAGPASRILGAYAELQNQSKQLCGFTESDEPTLDPSLEAIQVEVDLLNQIDQLIRRINEGGESFNRLATTLEGFDKRITEIESKWSKETLGAVQRLGDAGRVLEQAVRLRAWGRLVDNLRKARTIIEDQVLPIASDSLKIWDGFLSSAGTGGQDIESCLASMLLGVKQLSQEIERYVGQATAAESSRSPKTMGWFDRLKTSSTKVVEEGFAESAPAIHHQREWIARLAREIEAVKVATEFALQSSQGLVERVQHGKDRLSADTSSLGALLNKASAEWERLRSEWISSASLLSIDESLPLEQLVTLLRDAGEHLAIVDARHDIAVRVEERRHVQTSLEALVRRWWEMIGSQKCTDLSNVSFLIVEAKGALRYREGRKQRIQKGLEETSKASAYRQAGRWVSSRMEELKRDWARLFTMSELTAPDIDHDAAREVSDVALRCATLLDMGRLEERERFAAASLWPSRLDSAVVVYRWPELHVAAPQRTAFLKSLNSFLGDSGAPVLLLVADDELAQLLSKAGTGAASFTEVQEPAEVSGPRREGGVVKAEIKARRNSHTAPKPPAPVKAPSVESKGSLLTPKAEAALRILNPKNPRS